MGGCVPCVPGQNLQGCIRTNLQAKSFHHRMSWVWWAFWLSLAQEGKDGGILWCTLSCMEFYWDPPFGKKKNKAHKYWRMTKVTCSSSEDLNPPTSRNCLCLPKPAWPRPCISSGALGCRPGSTWCTRGQWLWCRGLQTWKIPLRTVCHRQTGASDCHSTRRTKGKQSRVHNDRKWFFKMTLVIISERMWAEQGQCSLLSLTSELYLPLLVLVPPPPLPRKACIK